jgi:hypothetical protein
MQRLNAIDAISPAWNHTHRLLLSPPRWQTLLKVGAVAVFAQVGGCNANLNFPGNMPHHSSHLVSAALLSVFLFVGLVALIIGLAFFYLGSRLQLVLFELVLRQETRVAPIWSRYSRVVWQWIGLKLLFYLVMLVCALPVVLPLIIHFIHTAPALGSSDKVDPMPIFALLLETFVASFFIILVFSVCYSLLTNFGLPSIALEATPMAETLRRIFLLIRQEPGQVALFLLMRFVLGLAWSIGAGIALGLSALVLLIPLGGIALILWAALHHAGLIAHIFLVCAWVTLGAAFLVAIVIGYLILLGNSFTFLQAYTPYFLGGRYPLLGNLLEPGPGAPFTPPPVFPSSDERKDSDGGPPMPMNPAVA